MGKKDVGVFQMENGYWAYRFKMVVDGKEISLRKYTDEHGNKLNNKTEAIKAREAAMVAARTERQRQRKISRRTIKEVFEEYREKGCSGKAYKTLLKQDSLWKNHFSEKWGKRYVDDISAAEINDYLAELYFEHEYAYRYVESFLKVFYLIFGQAYLDTILSLRFFPKAYIYSFTLVYACRSSTFKSLKSIHFIKYRKNRGSFSCYSKRNDPLLLLYIEKCMPSDTKPLVLNRASYPHFLLRFRNCM